MPELPNIVVYLDALSRLLHGKAIQKAIVKSPFLLRTFDPPLESVEGPVLAGFSRIGKRILWHCDDGTRMVCRKRLRSWKINGILWLVRRFSVDELQCSLHVLVSPFSNGLNCRLQWNRWLHAPHMML